MLAGVLEFGTLFGLIGAIIGVPIAAGSPIVAEEITTGRRARIAAADAAEQQLGSAQWRLGCPSSPMREGRPVCLVGMAGVGGPPTPSR